MSTNSVFDVIMEIQQTDRQISDITSKVQTSHQKLLRIDKDISFVKDLQLKAQTILQEVQIKNQNTSEEMTVIEEKYNSMMDYLNNFVDDGNNATDHINQLKLQKRDLIEKIEKVKTERNDLARKLVDVETKISIEKKKNAAKLIRLQKSFEKTLSEEKHLQDKYKI